MSLSNPPKLLQEFKCRVWGMGVAMDWEALGMFHNPPKDYHFTNKSLPDKRYANYPEVVAYFDAEQELRSHLIKQSQVDLTVGGTYERS